MHQPDSRIQKYYAAESLKTKYFDHFYSHRKTMETALKKPKQANGWSSNIGYIF